MTEQPGLAVHLTLIRRPVAAGVVAVGLEHPRPSIIAQLHLQHRLANVGSDRLLFDREDNLDAAVQVARHQIGTAQVHFRITAVLKVVDAAVLQEAPDNADHADVLADTGQTGPQTADAAHNQIHLYADPRSSVERADQPIIHQRVHLEDETAAATGPCVLDLPVDQRLETVPHASRRHQQAPVELLRGVAGQGVEQLRGVGRHRRITRQQTHVGVNAGGDRVVVAGRQVQVAPQRTRLTAHHQGDLAVRFQPHQAVDHVHPRTFQRAAQPMLLSSSKRAFSSTSTATCLPLRWASRSDRTTGALLPTR